MCPKCFLLKCILAIVCFTCGRGETRGTEIMFPFEDAHFQKKSWCCARVWWSVPSCRSVADFHTSSGSLQESCTEAWKHVNNREGSCVFLLFCLFLLSFCFLLLEILFCQHKTLVNPDRSTVRTWRNESAYNLLIIYLNGSTFIWYQQMNKKKLRNTSSH